MGQKFESIESAHTCTWYNGTGFAYRFGQFGFIDVLVCTVHNKSESILTEEISIRKLKKKEVTKKERKKEKKTVKRKLAYQIVCMNKKNSLHIFTS